MKESLQLPHKTLRKKMRVYPYPINQTPIEATDIYPSVRPNTIKKIVDQHWMASFREIVTKTPNGQWQQWNNKNNWLDILTEEEKTIPEDAEKLAIVENKIRTIIENYTQTQLEVTWGEGGEINEIVSFSYIGKPARNQKESKYEKKPKKYPTLYMADLPMKIRIHHGQGNANYSASIPKEIWRIYHLPIRQKNPHAKL